MRFIFLALALTGCAYTPCLAPSYEEEEVVYELLYENDSRRDAAEETVRYVMNFCRDRAREVHESMWRHMEPL